MKSLAVVVAAIGMFFLGPAAALAVDGEQTDRIKFFGDFRLRYEAIDEDFEVARNRMRFRGRFGMTAIVSDDVRVIVRLATGGDNPVSTNQSFDAGFSGKDIGLDLAYVDWKISEEISFFAGKMKNPLFRAGSVPLTWDSDLTPEGLAIEFSTGRFFATAAGFSIEERSSSDDSMLFVAQAGVNFSLRSDTQLSVGGGYFVYTNTVGNAAFHNGNAKGNSLDINDDYINKYKDLEFFAQWDTMVAGWPLKLFAHLARNTQTNGQDTAQAYGAEVGSSRGEGQSQFTWIYQDIEADSVIGTFNDSDFGGGGTDSRGHIVKAKYGLSKNIFVGGTIFINMVEGFQGVEHDYNRIQLDVEFKFD